MNTTNIVVPYFYILIVSWIKKKAWDRDMNETKNWLFVTNKLLTTPYSKYIYYIIYSNENKKSNLRFPFS